MTSARLSIVLGDVEGAGGELVRAWPRDDRHLLLEAEVAGARVAGQWFADEERAAAVAASTPGADAHGRLVLQPGGADRRLPALAGLLSGGGAQLLAHRPERRGVVRRTAAGGDTVYTKVVRPDRLPGLVISAARVAGLPVATPGIAGADPATGSLTTEALPGRPLRELLVGGGATTALRSLGEALAALHELPVPAGTPRHDAVAESGVVDRWTDLADAWQVPPSPLLGASPDPVRVRAALHAGPASRPVLLHRDLHDGQVLVAPDGSIGLLDFDLLAAGEAALDVANLLVHLDLRRRQGQAGAVAPLVDALLEGYRPSADVLARVPAYAAATRTRLAALYAFRPGPAGQLL